MLWLIVTLLTISGSILLFLGVIAVQQRSTKAARAFSMAMFCASLWSFGFAAEVISPGLEAKIFWANLQFIGIQFLPLSWLAMTLYYTKQPRWTTRSLFYLSFVPLVILLMIWSDPYHHLFRKSPSLDLINPTFFVLNNDYGIFFYAVSAPFGYLLFAVSLFLLTRFWIKSSQPYSYQGLTLLLSLSFPLFVDILYVLGITPIPNFNFTTVAFSLSGLFVSWSVFSLHFFDITPLANDVVFERMQVGVIVLDKQGRIININVEAEKITGISAEENIGILAKEVFPSYASFLNSDVDESGELILEQNGEKNYYAARVSLIFDKQDHLFGRVITLNNISERVKLYQKVKEVSITDSLTGVLNRRAFTERGETEIARTLRHQHHLSLVVMDLDNLKPINDKYGHRAGDSALMAVIQLCRKEMRSSDEIARYGGDEFVILLPETNVEEAFSLAERICRGVEKIDLEIEKESILSLSVSMGVSGFDGKETLESLLHRADQALYEAKRAGKNQVVKK
ncbi:MAG: diguanylate cyclase [Chloroflexi bacterium]|nr:diguanylate cyclase [Chloroflexota bacterium]